MAESMVHGAESMVGHGAKEKKLETKDSKLKGGSSTVGGVRFEVVGRKGIIVFFPQSTNQRINQSTPTNSTIKTILTI